MMAHASRTVVIRRPVESVFDFVLNGANNRLWKRSVLEVRPLGDAPYGPGSKFQQVAQGPEGAVSRDYQITECKANEQIELQVMSGPMRWSGTYSFTPRVGATEVTMELAAERDESRQTSDLALLRAMDEEVAALDQLKAFLEKMAS